MAANAVPPNMGNITISPAGFSTPGLPNHGWRVWLALVIMIVISGTFVVFRVIARVSARQMGSDDYAIVAALVG